MSLNTEELVRTRTELRSNLLLAGLTDTQVTADLGWSTGRLRDSLGSTDAIDLPGSSDPVDVWQLRDYLERAVRDAGNTPIPFTILTSRNRIKAHLWFRLRKAPRHHFPAS